jgi:peptide/nickel transport system permease protein
MGRYLIRRLLIGLIVLFGITIINFIFISVSPGDPVRMRAFQAIEGDASMASVFTEEFIKEQRALLGLDKPLPVRYFYWVTGLLQGNLGNSINRGVPVAREIKDRIGPTLRLTLAALLIKLILGLSIGVYSALRHYSLGDYLATISSFLALSVPNFFLGLVAIYLVALKLDLLPTSGMQTLGKPSGFLDQLRYIILPATVLGAAGAATLVRYMRSSLLEVLREDYITTARSKGLRERVVILRHAIRNGLLPIITIISLQIPALFAGSVVIESVFAWPGMGTYAVRAVNEKDYPAIMAVNLISAILVLLANLTADIAYAIADPRIRYS